MDNLTHTLVGVLVGESIARATRTRASALGDAARRGSIVTLMALGSNVPDLDFIQSRITDSKLDYLLHHRGHTHTILGALAIAALLYLACELWWRWRRRSLSTVDRIHLMATACTATLLHIGLDYTNSYGVHPFWPIDNRWHYGDAIFIVEPLFWTACAPLMFLLRTKLARSLVALAVLAGLVLSFTTGMVPLVFSIALVALAIAMVLIGWLARPWVAVTASVSVWLVINAIFFQASALARAHSESIAETLPGELLDTVLTPMPVNPLCWQLLLVEADGSNVYVRRGTLALAPMWMSARQCPRRGRTVVTTAPLTPLDSPDHDSIVWDGEIKTPRATLSDWIAKDCNAAAFMRFARAPWLIQRNDRWILGDARFDHERELSFAEIELDAARTDCASSLPPWVAPRAELLRDG